MPANAQVYNGTLHTFTVGGASRLATLESATLSIEEITVDGRSIDRTSSNIQATKRRLSLSATLFDNTSVAGQRVSHLHVSAASLGTFNLLTAAHLASLELTLGHNVQQAQQVSAEWEWNQTVTGTLSGSLELVVRAGQQPLPITWLGASLKTAYTTPEVDLAFTIDGVAHQVPVRVTGVNLSVEQDGLQRYTVTLGDKSGHGTPTILPPGSATLWEKALNDFRTAISYTFQAAGSSSFSATGNLCWNGATLRVSDNELVRWEYNWLGQGQQTITGVT